MARGREKFRHVSERCDLLHRQRYTTCQSRLHFAHTEKAQRLEKIWHSLSQPDLTGEEDAQTPALMGSLRRLKTPRVYAIGYDTNPMRRSPRGAKAFCHEL